MRVSLPSSDISDSGSDGYLIDSPETTMQSDLGRALKKGLLPILLRKAKGLRDLKLSFYRGWCEPGEIAFMGAELKDALRDTHFTHLYELGLAHCTTSEGYLIELLLRHKDTLRRLSLSEIQLRHGTWEHFFQIIGGKLPALRAVKLRGCMESQRRKCLVFNSLFGLSGPFF